MSVAVIVNPISGTGGRAAVAQQRVDTARSLLHAHGVDGDVFVSEGPGHARELAAAAAAGGASTVIAWGGDGTVNEVGSALAFGPVPLGIIPSGSGNGLARELRLPMQPAAAFAIALGASERVIDCGEVDGRLFFNIAGMGVDARVSRVFAEQGLVRRGFRRYVELTVREIFRDITEEHTLTVNGRTITQRILVLAIANSRQYGNGATIAPRARLDDGLLDVVVVAARSPMSALLFAPLLLLGLGRWLPGVIMMEAAELRIGSNQPVLYHTDGEPYLGSGSIEVRVHPRALHVKVSR